MFTLTEQYKVATEVQIKNYDKWKQDTIDAFEGSTRLSTVMPARLQRLNHAPGVFMWWKDYGSSELYISIPWNPKMFDYILSILQLFEWEMWFDADQSRFNNNKPAWEYYFKNPNVEARILLEMKSGNENSTCELVQVGTKETPVYEVRC